MDIFDSLFGIVSQIPISFRKVYSISERMRNVNMLVEILTVSSSFQEKGSVVILNSCSLSALLEF